MSIVHTTVQVEKSHNLANSCVKMKVPGISWNQPMNMFDLEAISSGFPQAVSFLCVHDQFKSQAVESFPKVPQPLHDLIKPDIVHAGSGSKALPWVWVAHLEAMSSWTMLDSFLMS